MRLNLAQKLIKDHLVSGRMQPGEEIAITIDQTLTQDATGTMVMLELEAMGIDKVETEISAQYVDHNILQTDFRNADDHLFLKSGCDRFGIHFSGPGNGVSHPVHMQRLGIPGKTLLGADSHTCAAGAIGMLAIGTGGLEVALAMAGQPFVFKMPKIFGVKLVGELPHLVSAKDIILEMLRRFDVAGGVNKIIEYYGPGLKHLSAMDRHVIANMGAELGATTSVFPADAQVKTFLQEQGREKDYQNIFADDEASYDEHAEIDLFSLEPLIACPSSPGNVVRVRDVSGKKIYQSMIGSSANPGLRDFAAAAMILDGQSSHRRVSLDINPTSRQDLQNLVKHGFLAKLISAGARIHQTGCNGCIGMGQAPATDRISLRTVPRNFPGRSGTRDDLVYLCSPETAAASAITGEITDPRDLGIDFKPIKEPKNLSILPDMVRPPAKGVDRLLIKGPNITSLPRFDRLENDICAPVLLKMGDDISTDEILPAGAKALPYRSNIAELAKFSFSGVEEGFYRRVKDLDKTGFVVIGGHNYGQGSSREHAAIAPKTLGLKCVIAKSYARIHQKNLINFGIIPLLLEDDQDFDQLERGDLIEINGIRQAIERGDFLTIKVTAKNLEIAMKPSLSDRDRQILLAGGMINYIGEQKR